MSIPGSQPMLGGFPGIAPSLPGSTGVGSGGVGGAFGGISGGPSGAAIGGIHKPWVSVVGGVGGSGGSGGAGGGSTSFGGNTGSGPFSLGPGMPIPIGPGGRRSGRFRDRPAMRRKALTAIHPRTILLPSAASVVLTGHQSMAHSPLTRGTIRFTARSAIRAVGCLALYCVALPASLRAEVPIPIYITPYYNSEGPQISVGKYSRKLATADAKTILDVAKEFKKEKDQLRIEVMYVAAIRLYDLGQKDQAVYWFYTAQYRARLFMSIVEANRDGFADAALDVNQPYIAFFELLGPYINAYAFRDLTKLENTLKTVVEQGKVLPNFADLYPGVPFCASESWADKNQEVSDGLKALIERFKEKKNGGGGSPPIIQRIKAGDTAGAEKLVNAGADVNAVGENRETALVAAIDAGNKEIFVSLLKHGADPNAHADNGLTPMHLAAQQKDTFWLSELLAHGGNANVVNTGNPNFPKRTPIYYALSKRRLEAVKLLVDENANINFTEYYGKSPTYYAVEFGMYSAAKLLIERGADPKLWAEGNWSILDSNGWFKRGYGTRIRPAAKRAEYYELYDFLADKGQLPARDDVTAGESPEKDR
jgi:hypothetical protein